VESDVEAVRAAVERFGGLDIAFNAAGMAGFRS
jgi:NAD(P)-dependent dehydrogenase (short-subunit alcohol dehydrogenase family)